MTTTNDSLVIKNLRMKYSTVESVGFTVSDFLAAVGSPLDAMMYLRMLWPDFVRFNGMVFRKETLEDENDRDRIVTTLAKNLGSRTRTEQSFNLVEVPSGFFSRWASESSDETDDFLAEKLVDLWSMRLRVLFPDDDFMVKTVPADETGGERGVIFYIRRDVES